MTASVPALEELAHVRIVRELGARMPGTYLGRNDASEDGDLVLETYANLEPKPSRLVFDSACRMRAMPRHPHLVSVIACDRIGSGISIVTELVDGVPLDEVFFAMSLGARLRAVVDILAALSALHLVAGAPIVHGGILLRSSFAEKTGKTKLGFAYRRALCAKESYAPEMLLGDDAAIDARTDVYGAGVLLWEAVNGSALFGDAAPEDVVREQLAGRIAKPHVPLHDQWASTVVPVVARALAIDPKSRYASIAEMAAALRIAVRARLMTHADVIEELWPAETKPKHSSGIVPAAKPVAIEPVLEPEPEIAPEPAAELTMEPAPLAEGASSGIVPVAPRIAPVARATPDQPNRVPFIAAIVVVIAAVVAIGATLVHLTGARAHSSPVPEPVMVAEPQRTAPPQAIAPPETASAPAETASAPAPAMPQVHPKPVSKHPAKGSRAAYDPQSI